MGSAPAYPLRRRHGDADGYSDEHHHDQHNIDQLDASRTLARPSRRPLTLDVVILSAVTNVANPSPRTLMQ